MINALRTIVWSFILVLSLVTCIAFLAYVSQHGLDQRATLGALAGAIAFAVGVWFWLIYRS